LNARETYFFMTGTLGSPSLVRRRPRPSIWACRRIPEIKCLCFAYASFLLWIHGWKTCLKTIITLKSKKERKKRLLPLLYDNLFYLALGFMSQS